MGANDKGEWLLLSGDPSILTTTGTSQFRRERREAGAGAPGDLTREQAFQGGD